MIQEHVFVTITGSFTYLFCKSDCISAKMFTIFTVDGGWGEWTVWTLCDQTCGGGTRTRQRQCDKPAPQYSGLPCDGRATENLECNTFGCPGTKINLSRQADID